MNRENPLHVAGRRRRNLLFDIAVLLIGLIAVALGLIFVSAAFRDDRPDAAVFMRKLISIAIPLIVVGVGIALFGLHRLYRRAP